MTRANSKVSRKKILFLVGSYGTGGKERQLTEIIKRLPKDRYEIHLFMKNDNSYYFSTIKKHLVSYNSLDKSNFKFLDIMVLSQYMKSICPDVVFSFSTILCHFSLLLKLLGFVNYRLINGSIRHAPVEFSIDLRLERILYTLYKEVVANSVAGLRSFNQLKQRGRYVLYNGFDMNRVPSGSKEECRKELGLPDKFTVVMIARMDSDKDQKSFIRGAYQVLDVDKDFLFILIGDGKNKEKYELMVQSLKIEDKVLFIGETQEVESFLSVADISVLLSAPQHGEGIANVILESFACSTPVIATDNGGTKEVIKNSYNGYLIKNGDIDTLAKKITFLKRNSDILRSFSINGMKTVKNKFSIRKMIREFEEIVNNSHKNRVFQ